MSMTDNMMTGKKWKCRLKDVCWYLLFPAAVLVVLFLTATKIGKDRLKVLEPYSIPTEAEDPDAYKEVVWNGETYQYREDLIHILCMGIDGREKAVENTHYGFGPKADAVYLATIDQKAHSILFLNISRDTITKIRIIDSYGTDAGLASTHLCMQYACGDGLEWSCEMTSEAVSRLLNGIPVHGYCALYWNAVTPITDLVGPIGVEVPEYMTWVNPPVFHESGWAELDARQALEFVRDRDTDVSGSNEVRSGHQQEFMQALFRTAKEKIRRDPFLAWKLKEAVEDYLVTDLGTEEMLQLALWACSWNIDSLDIRNLPGESVQGFVYDEFHVDESAKQELLLELFYEKT